MGGNAERGIRLPKERKNASEFGPILGKAPYWIKGDQAGSEAEPGVRTRRSLRPVTSTDQMDEPRPPEASRPNINTRPLGAQVGPSSWPPLEINRSPEPSVCITPMLKTFPTRRV